MAIIYHYMNDMGTIRDDLPTLGNVGECWRMLYNYTVLTVYTVVSVFHYYNIRIL